MFHSSATDFSSLRSLPDLLLGQSASQNGGIASNVYSVTGSSGIFAKYERYTDVGGLHSG